jgi:multiple sugar transport system ATP-binding protein
VGARTEHLQLVRDAAGNGRIEWIEHLGDQNHLHIRVGDEKLVALADPYAPLASGDAVEVRLERPLYFAENGARLA